MREILFRGKRLSDGEWIDGNLFIDEKKDKHEILVGYVNYRIGWEVDPETVGQFTGLTDKNGKKIFEGDIIDASNEWWGAAGPAGHDCPIIAVEFSEFHCGFDPFADYDCDCDVYIKAKGCEIIGNIHDNPELLKGE